MSPLFNRAVIAGVGLIGGSLALAGKKAGLFGTIVGLSRNQATLDSAIALGIIDEGYTDIADAAKGGDLFFAATPVSSVVSLCQQAAPHLEDGCIITDGGSVKADISNALDKSLPENVRFVGGHPVAGTEKSGPAAAFDSLYHDRYTILTPTKSTAPEALAKVRAMWEAVGAKVVEMPPDEHDGALAVISHLPHLAAYALVETLEESDGAIGRFVAGGFRDATRIAQSNPKMWRDIFEMNQQEIIASAARYISQFNDFVSVIESGDFDRLEEKLDRVAELRRGMVSPAVEPNRLPDRYVVAIDGPAGSGKSTLAKQVAHRICGVMIDTGAMYRSVALAALNGGIDLSDEKQLGRLAESMHIQFLPPVAKDGPQRVVANDIDVTEAIRTPRVSGSVSVVATNKMVRDAMTRLQRYMGKTGRVVMEGRDIGSVVFPDADMKFFLVADDKIRAERRLKELRANGDNKTTLVEVLDNVRERDRIDSQRSHAPLVMPDDAVKIDTTRLSIDEVLGKMIDCLFS